MHSTSKSTVCLFLCTLCFNGYFSSNSFSTISFLPPLSLTLFPLSIFYVFDSILQFFTLAKCLFNLSFCFFVLFFLYCFQIIAKYLKRDNEMRVRVRIRVIVIVIVRGQICCTCCLSLVAKTSSAY